MSTTDGSIPSDEQDRPEVEIPVQHPPSASDDKRAESEAVALALGLDLQSTQTQLQISLASNRGKTDVLLEQIVRSFLILAAVLVGASFFVLFWHFLAPTSWLFLKPDRLQDLKELLLSGGIGAALALFGKSRFLDKIE